MSKENLLRQMAEHIGCVLKITINESFMAIEILKDDHPTYEYSHSYKKIDSMTYLEIEESREEMIDKMLSSILTLGILGKDKGL